jgi:hypothetical protein
MKIAIATLAFLCIALTGSAQTNAAPARPSPEQLREWRTNIVRVFIERHEARKMCFTRKPWLTKKYARLIATIDARGCPRSFRVAWIDYLEAWHKVANDPSGLLPAVEVIAGAAHGNLLMAAHGADGMAKDSAQRKRDGSATTDALFECQKIALKYGVDVPAD